MLVFVWDALLLFALVFVFVFAFAFAFILVWDVLPFVFAFVWGGFMMSYIYLV